MLLGSMKYKQGEFVLGELIHCIVQGRGRKAQLPVGVLELDDVGLNIDSNEFYNLGQLILPL